MTSALGMGAGQRQLSEAGGLWAVGGCFRVIGSGCTSSEGCRAVETGWGTFWGSFLSRVQWGGRCQGREE